MPAEPSPSAPVRSPGVRARGGALLARSPALGLALALGLLGCKESKVYECSETEPCPGFSTCREGVCEAKRCGTSADCGMEAWCDGGECVEGCQGDKDCYPGDFCDAGACKAGGCRNTSLDCDFNEFCDVATGECYEAAGYYCQPCDGNSTDPDQCGNEDNVCLNLGGGYGSFCGVKCDTEADCPAAYTCIPVTDNFGNVFTQQCVTYCWLYE